MSPDDGLIVARNMYRLINILRINCAPSWFYLQDYTEMHGQQNIKFILSLFFGNLKGEMTVLTPGVVYEIEKHETHT